MTEILDPKTDVAPLAEKLLSMGAKIVVIKCGSAGLYLAAGDRSALTDLEKQTGLNASLWARFEGFERSFKPARICSGTGAGDTCIAAFLTALLTKENPQMCLALAAAQGASCVEGYDALSGLRTLPQLKEKIAAGWKKNGSLPGGDKIPF